MIHPKLGRLISTLILVAVFAGSASSAALALQPSPLLPQNNVIVPFGYGPVKQFLSQIGGGTGTAQCLAQSRVLHCLSVSGGNSCSLPAPPNELISCGSPRSRPVDETAFQPVFCNGFGAGDGGKSGLINNDDFCLIANYMPQRNIDTIYQYDDFVRLGVNRRFGGAVFELYGTDKTDRILQNTGGALQLSLWAFSEQFASDTYARRYFAISPTTNPDWETTFDTVGSPTLLGCQTSYPGESCVQEVAGPNLIEPGSGVFPCAPNGFGIGAPYNPIQTQSLGCAIGATDGRVDSITSSAPGQLTIRKSNPANFSRSDAFSGLTWQQTSSVSGPYAKLTYTMASTGTQQDSSFQEIPALFLHDGMGAFAYYYTGSRPYTDATGAVSKSPIANGAVEAFQLSNRAGPFGTGASATLTEDWASTCDASETHCITIASFSPAAQDVILYNSGIGSYFGLHGFFSLTDRLNVEVQVVVFPYRFDDVISGISVRQWIYQLHGLYSRATYRGNALGLLFPSGVIAGRTRY